MAFFEILGRDDPTSWLLAAGEPAARWVALTQLLGVTEDAAEALSAREAVLDDQRTQDLLSRLPDWETDNDITGHDRPQLATNLLDLLASMGVREGDDPRITRLLDEMLAHADVNGRFQMCGRERGEDEARWGALLCDTHAIADVLLRFGRGSDPRVQRALDAARADLTDTEQGMAWPCRPDSPGGWRGPGRIRDCCPQTTLEALSAFSRVPPERRPTEVRAAARTILGVWRSRGTQRPYQFGHGRQFKQIKWPPTWYGAYEVVDTLGRLPEVWTATDGDPEDRRSLAEVAACLLEYNVAQDGTVTPLSVFKGFESYSFGQKKLPSPFATSLVWGALSRLAPLVEDIAAVDVMSLASSKGGTGVPMPTRVQR